MATIPDFTSVGVGSVSGRGPIPRASGRDPIGEAIGDLGQTIGKWAEKERHKQNELATTAAEGDFLRQAVDLRSQVQDDPDSSAWVKKYQDGIDKIRNSVGSNLRDTDARMAFDRTTQTHAIETGSALANAARERLKQNQRAGLLDSADKNIDAAIASQDQIGSSALLDSTNRALDAGVGIGIVTAEEAKTAKRQSAIRFAKGRADALDPESSLKALESGATRDANGQVSYGKTGTWVDAIPFAERNALVEEKRRQVHANAVAAEVEDNRKRAAYERAKKDAADNAANGVVSALIKDPSSVSPAAIANDPHMTYEQKHLMFDFQKARLKGDGEDKQGPGFWDAYQGVMAPQDDTGRITDPLDIYKRAAPGGDLTLPAAQKLVELLKQRQAGESKGEFETQSLAQFYKSAHDQIVEPMGYKMQGGEEANYRFFMDTHAAYEKGRAAGKTPQQLLTLESPDYIGKNVQSYVPKLTDDTLLDKAAPTAKAFSTTTLDQTIRSGPEGSKAGIKALQDAGSAISTENKKRYALKRGWISPAAAPQPTISGPTVPRVLQ